MPYGSAAPHHAWVRGLRSYERLTKTLRFLGDGRKLRYVVGDGREAWLVEVAWAKDLDWTRGLKPIERLQKE